MSRLNSGGAPPPRGHVSGPAPAAAGGKAGERLVDDGSALCHSQSEFARHLLRRSGACGEGSALMNAVPAEPPPSSSLVLFLRGQLQSAAPVAPFVRTSSFSTLPLMMILSRRPRSSECLDVCTPPPKWAYSQPLCLSFCDQHLSSGISFYPRVCRWCFSSR